MTKGEIMQCRYLLHEAERAEELIDELKTKIESEKSAEKRKEHQKTVELLKRQREKCLNLRAKIWEEINNLDDSLTRQVLLERYIHDKSWAAVAQLIGGGNTPDSVRKISERYLEKERLANK